MSYATVHLGRRFSAGLIDFIAVPTLALVLMLVTGAMEHAEAYADNQAIIRPLLLGLSSYYLLNGWLLVSRGQSLGKALLGIMIVARGTTQKASAWNLLFIRVLFFPLQYLLLLLIPGLVPLLDQAFILGKRRRALHDWICKTEVVHR
jgi:uncharacterized RDD family membrane protein YckC